MDNVRKKILQLCMVWCAICVMVIFPKMEIRAAEMKIHVINLKMWNVTVDGDAVLIQSGGKNLLMDTGCESASPTVTRYLKNCGVKELDLYISHFHGDHIGGASALLNSGYFKVKNVYLPAADIGSESGAVKAARTKLRTMISRAHARTVYLSTGKSFTVGDAEIEILGPIGDHSRKTESSIQYMNNTSLVAMITCGNVKYLTMGDGGVKEERALIKRYGKELRADIMKMSHHGGMASSSEQFLKYVQPRFSFACVRYKTNEIWKRFSQYGYPYITGQERASLVYNIKNDHISLFKDKKRLQGRIISNGKKFYIP